METSLKQELHKLIDKCDNELLLEEAKVLLQSDKDWWDELSDEIRISLLNLSRNMAKPFLSVIRN